MTDLPALAEELRALRKAARDYLRETASVPMRAVDCDEEAVDRAFTRLAKLAKYRG